MVDLPKKAIISSLSLSTIFLMTMSKQKKIIFFTNSEYGQANVVLATAYELVLAGCDVHIASYGSKGASLGVSITERITELNEGRYGAIPKGSKPVSFHCLKGPSMTEAMSRKFTEKDAVKFVHGTGVREVLRMYPMLMKVLCVWEPQDYMDGLESCIEILKHVDPDFIINERLCAQAIDACTLLSKTYVCLSPNTFKETIGTIQPYLFGLWGIPADCSGFGFPVPWYLRPLNVLLYIYLIISVLSSSNVKAVNAVRKARGLKTMFPFMVPYEKDIHYLIPSTTECDFHFPYIPKNVTGCGPIFLGSSTLSAADTELEIWLKNGPTVMFNLGSNMTSDTTLTRALATAMRVLLDQNPKVQILWKLRRDRYDEPENKGVDDILSAEMKNGRVRIESWLKAEPGAILRSGLIVCAVHHGGANSYFEAVNAGVPQIVLPLWFDTFDFAERVEYLGVGINGSKHSAPRIDPSFLGNALVEITDEKNEKGRGLMKQAKDLAKLMDQYKGRKTAADKILELSGL